MQPEIRLVRIHLYFITHYHNYPYSTSPSSSVPPQCRLFHAFLCSIFSGAWPRLAPIFRVFWSRIFQCCGLLAKAYAARKSTRNSIQPQSHPTGTIHGSDTGFTRSQSGHSQSNVDVYSELSRYENPLISKRSYLLQTKTRKSPSSRMPSNQWNLSTT